MTRPAKKHHPSNQCDGKRQWPRRRDARKAARRFMTHKGCGPLEPYLCPWCGWFHIGHPPKRRSA